MDNLDLKSLSAKLSCMQMTKKAKSEIDYYNNKFQTITMPNICINNYTVDNNANNIFDNVTITDNNKKKNNNTVIGHLPSLTVNKQSCILKKPHYNDGEWKNQYEDILRTNTVIFDEQTRNKFKSSKCPKI